MGCFLFGTLIVLFSIGSRVTGYQCTERSRKFGCFNDAGHVMMGGMKFKQTMKKSDWMGNGWNLHLLKLLCECSKEAKKNGHRFFGLEYYNECFTGNLAHIFNIEDKRTDNSKCWSETPDFLECKPEKQTCVGTDWTMEIYELTSNSIVMEPETEEPPEKIMTLPPAVARPPPRIPGPPRRVPMP